MTATLTVERASGSRVSFQTLCSSGSSGEVLVEGTALALIKPQTQAQAQQAQPTQQQPEDVRR